MYSLHVLTGHHRGLHLSRLDHLLLHSRTMYLKLYHSTITNEHIYLDLFPYIHPHTPRRPLHPSSPLYGVGGDVVHGDMVHTSIYV